ncbi:TetR/AcrR family transcriptional regulator [Patulibacter brassicae]|jgi:AcrR family transcriptional regulator|uniref:TetR/AcrR family transcriptional regulator n=1 Tax=Patulibacter brassicae TaxID=1705717 RepID=A0ABU4VHE6_9ACTN|nr:TetR/AcrR family transcriptional regulator [Patulibacter brassicae]MDX8151252.1 TetR/AcrR family transcriptional regulator [Patulibacter brassicae]
MAPAPLTAKGEATRARIVAATAERILAAGLGGTSLDDVRAATLTSKGQLFHYFPGGKAELVRAVAEWQGQRVLDAQRPALDALDSWASWEEWRTRLLAHYDAQHGWGCPIGSLASEAATSDPQLAAALADYLRTWSGYLAAGVERMRRAGILRADADANRLGTAVLAAIEGGLLLTRTEQALWPLEVALDGALAHLRSWEAPAE